MEASGLLTNLTPDDRKTLRKAVIAAILATDMSVHKDLLNRVTAKVDAAAEEALASPSACGGDGDAALREAAASDSDDAPPAPSRFPTASADDRALLGSFLLHCADLHNPLLPPRMSQRIAGELSREFAAQAAQEVAAQLPVTVMLAHTDLQKAQLEGACAQRARGCAGADARCHACGSTVSFIDYVVS